MPTALVVEDDPVSQKILRSLLEKRNHKIYVASTVSEALQQLESHTLIDLVVLDNQLQGEYGWEFLAQVRKDFVFKHIPVLVYSASSDRNSVLRYLQLGVQKILVKPYNGKKLEEEIQRAVDYDWRSMIFEPVDRLCQRLNISEDDYFKSLSSAADDVLKIVPQLNKLVGRRDTREFDDHLATLQSCAMNLGVSILENATEAIQTALSKDKLDQGIYFINRLVPTARLMQHRALAFFGMTSSQEDIPDNLLQESNKSSAHSGNGKNQMGAANASDGPLDKMLQNPLNAFRKDFNIFLEKRIFTREETIRQLTGELSTDAIQDVRDTLQFVTQIEIKSDDDLAMHIETDAQLTTLLLNMLNLPNIEEKKRDSIKHAIKQIGKPTAACLYVVFAWLKAARRERNPLVLDNFARRTLAVAMVSKELSLKFKESHAFVTSGLIHNVGSWLLALRFPSFYGIALTIAANDKEKLKDAELAIFGITSDELAIQAMVSWNIPKTYIDVYRNFKTPSTATPGSSRILSSITNLSYDMVRLQNMGYTGYNDTSNEDEFIKSEAWESLKEENVDIPLNPTEYLSALQMVLNRVKRQLMQLFG